MAAMNKAKTYHANTPETDKNEFRNTHAGYSIKKFPPFGKRLDALRHRGLVPLMRVIVATDWRLGRAFPRIIVTPDALVENLKFNYLAGLHVQIVHHDLDSRFLESLIIEILSIKPASLATFNMDSVNQGKPAFKLIFSNTLMEVV